MKKIVNTLGFAILLAIPACSTKQTTTPDFYPNETLRRGGAAQAQAASQYCMALSDEYVQQPDRFKEALKAGTKGAVIGAGTGAIGGAIFSEAGRGTGAGAAIGGVLGVLKSLNETGQHSPTYERFVEHCLQKKGYEVIGWSNKKPGLLG